MPRADLIRSAVILAAVAAALYASACALLFLMQRSLIYYPPAGGAGRTDVNFAMAVDGATVLVSTAGSTGSRAVVYFGGNGEDVAGSMPELQRAFPNEALFALHYRGYTGSTGTPSEKAIIADALALFDLVHRSHPEIVVIGRSLGSGVAIHVASMRPAQRLVLVTPYDSLQEIAAQRFPFFPVRWLLLDKYESWRYASAITMPTLLIAAEFDSIIPASSTQRLYARLVENRTILIVVPDADHNSISRTSQYPSLLSR